MMECHAAFGWLMAGILSGTVAYLMYDWLRRPTERELQEADAEVPHEVD